MSSLALYYIYLLSVLGNINNRDNLVGKVHCCTNNYPSLYCLILRENWSRMERSLCGSTYGGLLVGKYTSICRDDDFMNSVIFFYFARSLV